MLRRRGHLGLIRGATALVLLLGCSHPPEEAPPASAGPAGFRAVPLAPDACDDDRYPALAGPWVVGCSESGLVDRVMGVEGGEMTALAHAARSPALAEGAMYAPGFDGGVWHLPDPAPERIAPIVSGEPLAIAFDGAHLGFLWPNGIELVTVGEKERTRYAAAPVTRDLAMVWPWAAWVEDGVRRIRADGTKGDPVPGTRVAAGGGRFAWTTEDAVCAPDCVPAQSGFLSAPAVDDAQLCWEDRSALRDGRGDVRVVCTDRTVEGVTHPSVWGGWLLVRSRDGAWLAREAG